MRGPKCWVCNDTGMVLYEKIENNISYEMVFRCSCQVGLRIGNSVAQVGKELAMELAMENYEKAIV